MGRASQPGVRGLLLFEGVALERADLAELFDPLFHLSRHCPLSVCFVCFFVVLISGVTNWFLIFWELQTLVLT